MQVIHYTTLHTIDDELMNIHKSFCVEVWPSVTARRVYSLVVFAVQFCLPLLATSALYLRIYARLRTRRAARRRLETRPTSTSARADAIKISSGTGSGRRSRSSRLTKLGRV